jgi:hypothetical protein
MIGSSNIATTGAGVSGSATGLTRARALAFDVARTLGRRVDAAAFGVAARAAFAFLADGRRVLPEDFRVVTIGLACRVVP